MSGHGAEVRSMVTRSAKAAFALGAACALSGCVAAAIPVLAAGGIVKSRTDGRDGAARPVPRVAIPAEAAASPRPIAPPPSAVATPPTTPVPADRQSATARDYAFADGSQVTVTNNLGRAATVGEAPPPPPGDARLTGLTALPPPSPRPAIASPPALPSGARLTDLTALPPPSGGAGEGSGGASAFASYVTRQAAVPIIGSERRSAILTDAASLSGQTRPCSIHPPAVLIDLDPAGGLIETTQTNATDPAFAAQLAALRREEVVIGWTSNRTADRAGAIRAALRSSGLDPEGRDQLVLLRFPEESKQTRRDEFARSHCVVALAGDERADFDELYQYLKDPSAAAALEPLVGNGWFLVPTPLN